MSFLSNRRSKIVTLTVSLVLSAGAVAAPAFAVDKVDCNWLKRNCKGAWDHGYSDKTV